MSVSDGSALAQWDNLPRHLSQALEEALEGLQEAYLDTTHPMSPQLVALWDVADQIELWVISQEGAIREYESE